MALAAGMRLGPYEVVALIGVGGMGEVYRARDTKLNRDVAIKVLPDLFAHDPERLARFQREAQVLASLNHPNIAIIYGLEEAAGIRALVMELIEGPTLAERLKTEGSPHAARGLPLGEALPIARQIAEALEAAHERGVVHRDLKPANVKVTPDGHVKVLDFGLAKLVEREAPAASQTMSPTLSMHATYAGVILGTAAYMSPEQARGKPVDRRTDIWAFGCVLYEMLTGRRPFEGEEVSDVLARIIEREPDFGALPPTTPPAIRRLLRRSFEKDRKRRLPDIADARIEIDDALSAPASPDPASVSDSSTDVSARSTWPRVAMVGLAGLVLGAAVAAATVWFSTRPSPPRVTRTMITSSGATALTASGIDRDLAIAPDGARIVYVGGNGTQLLVRAMDQLEPTPLTGLVRPLGPFFSPDGQWIGFFNGNTSVSKVAITGGPAIPLCRTDGSEPRGATWAPDGTIVFATSNGSLGLQRVSASGGEPAVLTRPNRERGEADHLWPEYLPGGQAVLFTITPTVGGIENAQVAVLDLQTGTQKVLVRGGSHARYLPTGHLVYGAGSTLRAVAFDLDRLEAATTPVAVLPQVAITAAGAADFDVSRDGTLVYRSGDVRAAARTLVWIDRQGREEPVKAPARAYLYPRLSPDSTRIALDIRDQDNDIWMWDIARETLTRVTSDPALDRFPVWMPDGRRLVFSSNRAGLTSLFLQAADGTAAAERLTQGSTFDQMAMSVSPDGAWAIFREDVAAPDLMMVALDKDHRMQPLIRTPANEGDGVISPDGRWLAYHSDDSGQFEIYVRPFPDVNAGRWPISTAGGVQPLWARNSQELFYLAPTGALMSVPIGRGAGWAAGAPRTLLAGPYFNTVPSAAPTYDVSLDAKRFLMIRMVGGGATETAAPVNLVVVQNWFEELKRLAPTGR